jgi:type III pantothenate kinase
MGTIIKVMALDKTGALIGGTLSPGMRLCFEVMAEGTAALPLVGSEEQKKVIGTNTVDCIRSGVLNGAGAMLDGLIMRFEKELGVSEKSCTVVATGGNAAAIKPYCERDFTVNPHLVSQGLRIIHNKNASHQ